MGTLTSPIEFKTLDSGARESFAGGMVRDTETGKPRFDLLYPSLMPYQRQMLTRVAALMARGAEKYGDRNWEKASDEAALSRYRSSGMRHHVQHLAGETDEDHAAAVIFNLIGEEYVKWVMETVIPTGILHTPSICQCNLCQTDGDDFDDE